MIITFGILFGFLGTFGAIWNECRIVNLQKEIDMLHDSNRANTSNILTNAELIGKIVDRILPPGTVANNDR